MTKMLFVAGGVVGAVGDVGLQLANATQWGNTGLRPYFAGRGPFVSVLSASALTAFWSGFFEVASPVQTMSAFMAYAAGLDVVYRVWHAQLGFPDLDEYYRQGNPFATILYNVVAAGLVWQANSLWFTKFA